MPNRSKIIPNFYRDSVSLMQLSSLLSRSAGIRQFSAFMASENNIGLLVSAGLLSGKIEAGSNDLILAAEGDTEAALDSVMDAANAALRRKTTQDGTREKMLPKSIAQAKNEEETGTLALIAVPGEHAASEALKSLRFGMDVMIFSDNVSVEDEVMLKQEAAAEGLIVMGPDCGTAIVQGTPLAFANSVRRGKVGLIGASGAGLQHLCCRIHAMGGGISHALGVGGRDLKEAVGGLSTLRALDMLAVDADTQVICIVSKPPASSVMQVILEKASSIGKPIVALFLGSGERAQAGSLYFASTLEDAGRKAMELAYGQVSALTAPILPPLPAADHGRRFLRGLFSGGTFCYEAAFLLSALPGLKSNTPLSPDMKLHDPWKSEGHTLIDLGDDEFTRGRPHPMIDQRLRCERLLRETRDPETAIILFDMVLGYGAHPDPASELVEAVSEGRRQATQGKGSGPVFVAFVCGSSEDPQGYDAQCEILAHAGVVLAPSNTQAALTAHAVLETHFSARADA